MLNAAAPKSKSAILRSIGHWALVFLSFLGLYVAFFAPTWTSNNLLAPGDGLIFYVPAFYGAKALWSNFLLGGLPWAADPQHMAWYPLAMLLRLIPHSWNLFVLSAYVLAGVGTYAYVYTLTASWLAAAVAGMAYSMGGFMTSHLGHTTIIHAAAWLPLILYALERLRHRITARSCAVGLLAIASCSLSGHPQIAVYALGLGLCYALVMSWCLPVTVGRSAYYRAVGGLYLVGLSLCAIQLLPMVELSQLSSRATMTFGEFCGFAMPPLQLFQLIFPYLFGGSDAGPYDVRSFWGQSSPTEITGYIGLLPLMLAAIGVMRWRSERAIVWFWLVVAILTTMFALGGATFISHWLYQVPVYNKFRSPARHFVEMNFAISVLAGLGVAAIQRAWATQRLVGWTILAAGSGMLGLLGLLVRKAPALKAMALTTAVDFRVWPWQNPAIGIPLLIMIAGVLALRVWSRRPNWRPMGLMLLVVLFWDVSSFGWFYDWRPEFAPAIGGNLAPNAIVKKYRPLLQASHQRFMTVNGAEAIFQNPEAIAPNLTQLWELPSADGYGPLMLSRVAEIMQIVTNGNFLKLPTDPLNRGIDLMAVRYLLFPPAATLQSAGVEWAPDNLQINLGAGGCVAPGTAIEQTLQLNQSLPAPATAIAFVSQMGCSVAIPNAAAVLQVETIDAKGDRQVQQLRAGQHTAEFAYDCADVQPKMQHPRPQSIFRSFPIARPQTATCKGHEYVGILPLQQPQSIRQMKLKWLNYPGSIAIQKISMINPQAGMSQPLLRQHQMPPNWQPVAEMAGGTVYENQRALPRTWLVGQTVALKPAEVLQTIQRSQLPDGQPYDPLRLALVEDPQAVLPSIDAASGAATVTALEQERVVVQTASPNRAFLVLSDVNYPGWQATIDGQPTKIYQTNYVQRGVQVPAGEHVVEYRFEPMSFKLGAGITLGVLCGAGYWLWRVGRSTQNPRLPGNQ
jgi:Bacterial membrane protein YfhO